VCVCEWGVCVVWVWVCECVCVCVCACVCVCVCVCHEMHGLQVTVTPGESHKVLML